MTREKAEITALMLYYGRRDFAEEAVESFLRQTYSNKRLLIINTHPDPVWFEQENPNIDIHNCRPDTFKNLNEKYNYGFSQIKTNWWCPWDSDDIWMPWHMENLAGGIPDKKFDDPVKVGISQCYFAMDNVIKQSGWNMWTNCIFETLNSKGILHPNCDENSLDNCDKQILLRKKWKRWWLTDSPPSLIFRWDDSGHGSEVVGEKAPAFHEKLRARMNSVRNTDPFNPHWDRNYIADVDMFNRDHDWRKSKYYKPESEEKR